MELKLNIYNNKKEIEKTYVSNTFDIMFGTIEDIFEGIEIDKLTNAVELGKMVLRLMPTIKPFLKDVFEGLTDEELRRAKSTDIIALFIEIYKFGFSEFNTLGGNEKN